MANQKTGRNPLVILVLVAIGLYLAYIILVLLAKVFVFLGYNTLFFTDNLLEIKGFNPVVSWAIFGLFAGSIAGVIVAVKKYQLSKLLILYPVGATVLFILIMYFVNKPSGYPGSFYAVYQQNKATEEASQSSARIFYITTAASNVRTGPSLEYDAAFSVKKKTEVEVLQRKIVDNRNIEWFKIRYNNKEGYISAKNLQFSRTGN